VVVVMVVMVVVVVCLVLIVVAVVMVVMVVVSDTCSCGSKITRLRRDRDDSVSSLGVRLDGGKEVASGAKADLDLPLQALLLIVQVVPATDFSKARNKRRKVHDGCPERNLL
jgi:uncharacterized protein YceK